jgi:hypothetical protein
MNADIGFETLQALMADFASAYLEPAFKVKKSGSSLERPTDSQFSTIFYGFTEISSTLDALFLTEKLVGLAPPRSKGINKDEYIKFLVGAYLQEVYILEQRLSAYAKKISRLYRMPSLPSMIKKIVYEPLEAIITTRGSHVHAQRYSDKDLDMVSTTALFHRLKHELGTDLDIDYYFAQQEWKKRIKKNNAVTRKIVDQYFKVLHSIICVDGVISFPLHGN